MVIQWDRYTSNVLSTWLRLFLRNSDSDIWHVSKSDIDDFKTATADITTPPNRAPLIYSFFINTNHAKKNHWALFINKRHESPEIIMFTDPLHTKEYLANNIFMPLVNNNNNSKFADKQSKL
jgi:hypothetical protein